MWPFATLLLGTLAAALALPPAEAGTGAAAGAEPRAADWSPAAAPTPVPPTPQGPPLLHRYQVDLDGGLTRLRVRGCLPPERASARLTSGSRRASTYLRIADDGPLREAGDGRHLRIDASAGTDGCFSYDVDLAAALAADSWRTASRYGDDLLMRSTLWLWRVAALARDEDIEITFVLPAGFNVSVPWHRAPNAAPDEHRYRVGHTPVDWPARTVFGRFRIRLIDIPGGQLRLACLHGTRADRMASWLGEAAGAVTTLYGRFPVPSPQVVVVPLGNSAEAVPWAQVVRGGGAAALFFVDETRPLEQFRQDWTATHEFSHLLIPYLSRNDAWLSEGLASYYQNVLRARAGMLDERSAWERMEAGFARGRAKPHSSTLERLSRDMHEERAHRRVYWSGAAYWLEADVALRRESAGTRSLDTVLAALRECCLPASAMWTGPQLLERLDALGDTRLFTSLARQYLAAREFPDMSPIYDDLGVRVRGDHVSLDDDAAGAGWRRGIMGRRHSGPPAVNAAH
jgi:hypothetical protein